MNNYIKSCLCLTILNTLSLFSVEKRDCDKWLTYEGFYDGAQNPPFVSVDIVQAEKEKIRHEGVLFNIIGGGLDAQALDSSGKSIKPRQGIMIQASDDRYQEFVDNGQIVFQGLGQAIIDSKVVTKDSLGWEFLLYSSEYPCISWLEFLRAGKSLFIMNHKRKSEPQLTNYAVGVYDKRITSWKTQENPIVASYLNIKHGLKLDKYIKGIEIPYVFVEYGTIVLSYLIKNQEGQYRQMATYFKDRWIQA